MPKEANVVEAWIEAARAEWCEARGRAEGARRIVLRLLREAFGELPPAVVRQIEEGSVEWCEELAVRARTAQSLQELSL